jgi:hypothetical protein
MSHKKYRSETDCLNCGTQVIDKFCHHCGQENLDTHENFFHMVGHFISDYLHFDSKFFRSLIPLFTKPGFLTRQYWAGKRVTYIHPLRLFFFITIIFMISTSYFYHEFGGDMKNSMVHGDTTLAKIDTAHLNRLPDSVKVAMGKGRDSVTVAELKDRIIRDARQVKKVHTGIDLVFTNLKYITFFLLPVYALIFKLIYIRRKHFYVDHLVYAMHLQTFAYFLFSIIMVLPFLLPIKLELMRQLSALGLLIYIGFSLHYLYKQVWWKTILKSMMATAALFFITALTIIVIALVDAIFVQN